MKATLLLIPLAGMAMHTFMMPDLPEIAPQDAVSASVVHESLDTVALDRILFKIADEARDVDVPRPYLKPKAYYTPDEWLYIARTPVKVDAPVIATAP